MKFNYVIICHSGAGNHSVSKENIHKNICKKACRAAQRILNDDSVSIPDLIKAVVEAVKVLEDHPCTNAGLGSNLTINGKLQCEAAVMCGQSLRYGAVGCLSNIKNPILVAEKLLNIQLQQPLLFGGRYPPSVLVGQDATDWAISNGIESVQNSELITVDRKNKYDKYKTYFSSNSSKKRSHSPTSEPINPQKKPKLTEPSFDTVGVIIADSFGRIVSATSSGGIFLKDDGRLGQSCMFGCGCYSEQRDNGVSVAAVSTGLGEQLMRTVLPLRVCDALANLATDDNESFDIHEWFRSFIDKNFMNSPFLSGDNPKSFGVCSLKRDLISDGRVSIDLLFGHSTPSMCLAYLSSGDHKAHAIMSRVVPNSEENFAVGSLGMVFDL